MPQMMPMNWILLFLYFFLIIIIFNVNMFFLLNNYPSNKNSQMNNTPSNWLW